MPGQGFWSHLPHSEAAGSAGQLRKGDIHPTDLTAASYAQDQTFLLVEVGGDDMSFVCITRTGATVDSGVIHRTIRP